MFLKVKEAYDVLSDPAKREAYIATLPQEYMEKASGTTCAAQGGRGKSCSGELYKKESRSAKDIFEKIFQKSSGTTQTSVPTSGLPQLETASWNDVKAAFDAGSASFFGKPHLPAFILGIELGKSFECATGRLIPILLSKGFIRQLDPTNVADDKYVLLPLP